MSGKKRNGTGLGIAGLVLAVPAGALNAILGTAFGLPGLLFCLTGLATKNRGLSIMGFCMEITNFLAPAALVAYICIISKTA